MVKYNCLKCKMEFNKKSNYMRHINKKFDCSIFKINDNKINEDYCHEIQNIPEKSKIFQKASNNLKSETIEIDKNNFYEDNKNNYDNTENKNELLYCAFCSKQYSTRSNLNKHLKNNCKIKKEKDEEKENTFKLLLEKHNDIKEQHIMINKILEQNQTLIKQIRNLKKININSKSIKITKNINSNNSINNNIMLVNFGKEDLNVIDKQIYFDRVVKKSISGVKIPEEILKLIYFNPQYPQLSNIYISDINREKCMIYEDGEWRLSPVDKIPEVIEKVVNYSNGVENIFRQEYLNNKKVNDRLNIVNKYVKMNDFGYIDELKEEEEKNKDVIKRCENFQKLTYDTIKTTMYNEGKNIKKINLIKNNKK